MKIAQLLNEVKITRIDDVYYPLDDTYLVLDHFDTQEFHDTLMNFNNQETKHILDMGCGTGILGYCAAYMAQTILKTPNIRLTFVDINPKAIKATKKLIETNEYLSDLIQIQYYQSNLFDEISNQHFDLILFNPPYLPQDEEIQTLKLIDHALYGGSDGISVLIAFFEQVSEYINPKSVIFFVASSLGAIDQLVPKLSLTYTVEKIQNVHLFFEDIILFRAQKIAK